MRKYFPFALLFLLILSRLNGQCVHFDPSPDIYFQNTTRHVDLDWNGTSDYGVTNSFFGPPQYNWADWLGGTDSNQVLCDANGPLALNAGDSICSNSQTWSSTDDLLIQYMSMNYYAGNWDNVGQRYAGLKFVMNGQWHYGWIRLSVGGSATILDWGYNLQPDSCITAGCADINGISYYNKDLFSVFSSGKQLKISLENGNSAAVLNLYNSSGQLVLQQTLNAPETLIDCAELAPGIYFAEVCDGERLFSQKILLTRP